MDPRERLNRLKRFLAENGCRCLNDFCAYRGEKGNKPYYKVETHLSKQGKLIIASYHYDGSFDRPVSWDLFVPAFEGNDQSRTIEEAQAYLDREMVR